MEYLKLEGNQYSFCDEAEAEYVLIPKTEYNGLQNALRIVRDRAIQQIDKSKADEHGYALLRAEKRKYSNENGKKSKAWLVSKSTPYSIKMSLQEASFVIKKDLEDYYGYRTLPIVYRGEYGQIERLTEKKLIEYYERFFLNKESSEHIGNESILNAISWMEESGGIVAFEIARISKNHGSGCYEVSYWTTEPV